MFEPPIAVHPSVVIDKDGRVEAVDPIHLIGILRIPVAHLERPVRTVALGNKSVAIARLVIGEQIIGLLPIGIRHQCHIRGIKYVGSTGFVKLFTLAVLVNHKDNTIITPVVQAVHRCRPYNLIATAVFRYQVVVRTIDVDTILARLVGVFKYIGFSVGNVFPKREIGIALSHELRVGSREFVLA